MGKEDDTCERTEKYERKNTHNKNSGLKIQTKD